MKLPFFEASCTASGCTRAPVIMHPQSPCQACPAIRHFARCRPRYLYLAQNKFHGCSDHSQVAATATTDDLGDAAVDLVEQLLEAYFMQVRPVIASPSRTLRQCLSAPPMALNEAPPGCVWTPACFAPGHQHGEQAEHAVRVRGRHGGLRRDPAGQPAEPAHQARPPGVKLCSASRQVAP